MDFFPSSPMNGMAHSLPEPWRLSTREIPPSERIGWLRDIICREYANVEVATPSRQILSQDLTIYPWDNLRLSVVTCNGVILERLPRAPQLASQDVYFAVVLLSGDYALEQDGKEAVLQPGDMTLYDATRPPRIQCPKDFEKIILSIPRPLLRARMAGVEHCTALKISGTGGIGAVTSQFLRASSQRQTHSTRYFDTCRSYARSADAGGGLGEACRLHPIEKPVGFIVPHQGFD